MALLGDMVANVSTNVSDTANEYWSPAEIKQAIGEAYRYYYFLLIKKGEGFFETVANLDVEGQNDTVSLALLDPPFKNISQLYRTISVGYVPLKQQEGRLTPIYTMNIMSGDAWQPQYKVRGMNIVFNPPPADDMAAALRLNYVYTPTFPSRTSPDDFDFNLATNNIDFVGFPTAYDLNVEIRATIKILESRDVVGGVSDIASFRAQLQELDLAFENSSENDEYPDSVQYSGLNYRNGGYF